MAAAKIRVNTGSLSKTQKDVQAKLDKIRSDMETISEDMGTLNSMWTGDAHDAFVASVTEDLTLLTEVCTALQNIINFEGNAVTEYDKCEQQVADIIAQIQV